MQEVLLIIVGTIVVNNFVLTRFLGLCPFVGVSKNFDASLGMGIATTGVLIMSSFLSWLIYEYLLIPTETTFLTTIVFILTIGTFVQLLEMVIKKYLPVLYNLWGVYLVLITTNCIVLGVPLVNVEKGYDLIKSLANSLGAGLGFTLAIVLMASMRERLRYADVPKPLEGVGITFILAGMLALSFFGFLGMITL